MIALRLVYFADVVGFSSAEVASLEAAYRMQHERYLRHLADMRQIATLIDHDVAGAAAHWNSIRQIEANDAFTAMMCEREFLPGRTKPLVATLAARHFGLASAGAVPEEDRHPKLKPADNQRAWDLARDGSCRSCGVGTISQTHHDRLRKEVRGRPDLFDLTPSYRQASGKEAPLWSARLLIAAKGVADHIKPWSQGGRTDAENLANVCAACNYSRNDSSLDVLRVAAYE